MQFLHTLFLLSAISRQSLAVITHRPPLLQYGVSPHTHLEVNYSLFLPPPSQDPWFSPPNGWDQASPGTALKTRASPYKIINIGNAMDTFQVLYRTSDTHSNASWAVTTVFIPASHSQCNATNPVNCSHAVVSYEVPYDSASFDASPSYLLQFSEPYGEIYDLLTRGYFVSVPDYEGPLASYTAGVQSGHATLDSVKAVLQVGGDFGLRIADVKAALWGYSGGAMATEFAAELAASYAPDLKLAGIVHGGLVPNITDAMARMNGQDAAGLLFSGIIGITSQHPEAREYINSHLKQNGTYNATTFYGAAYMNGIQVLLAFEYANVYDYFVNGSADLNNPIITNMYERDAFFGLHGTPNMPVFIYKAIQDQMSPASATDTLVHGFCEQGANILYHRNAIGGHNDELWAGRARALAFLSTVLDGTNEIDIPATGCQIVNVTIGAEVTMQDRLVMEGSHWVKYSAFNVDSFNVTMLPNGSVYWPTDNGSILIPPIVPNKRVEHLDFSDMSARALKGIKSVLQTLAEAGKRLDVLSPRQWWKLPVRAPVAIFHDRTG